VRLVGPALIGMLATSSVAHADVWRSVASRDADLPPRAYLDAHLRELAPGAAASDLVRRADHVDRVIRTGTFAQTAPGMPLLA